MASYKCSEHGLTLTVEGKNYNIQLPPGMFSVPCALMHVAKEQLESGEYRERFTNCQIVKE